MTDEDVKHVALKPCPFCGGEASLLDQKGPTGELYQWVECNDCWATARDCDVRSMQDDELHPIAAWNQRAGADDVLMVVKLYLDWGRRGINMAVAHPQYDWSRGIDVIDDMARSAIARVAPDAQP